MQNMTMTINIRKRLLRLHTARRRKRAVGLVREAVARFAKADIDKIKINNELNEFLSKNASGASFLWAKLKVNVEKGDDKVEVKLHGAKTESVSTAPVPKTEERKQKPEQKKTEKQA